MDFEQMYSRDAENPSRTDKGRQIYMNDHHFLDLQRRFVDDEPELFPTEASDYFASHRSEVKEKDERISEERKQAAKERADAAAREHVDRLERDLPRVRIVESGEGRQQENERGVKAADFDRTGGP